VSRTRSRPTQAEAAILSALAWGWLTREAAAERLGDRAEELLPRSRQGRSRE
jgi:hypothetical protein